MSPQLTLSSLFCALALALLCVVTTLGDVAGTRHVAGAHPLAPAPAQALISVQAEAIPGPQLS